MVIVPPTSGDPLRPRKSCILERFSTPYIEPFRRYWSVEEKPILSHLMKNCFHKFFCKDHGEKFLPDFDSTFEDYRNSKDWLWLKVTNEGKDICGGMLLGFAGDSVHDAEVGWSLGHWFVAVKTVSKIGLMIRSFVTCKWVFSVFLKRLYREATNQ